MTELYFEVSGLLLPLVCLLCILFGKTLTAYERELDEQGVVAADALTRLDELRRWFGVPTDSDRRSDEPYRPAVWHRPLERNVGRFSGGSASPAYWLS